MISEEEYINELITSRPDFDGEIIAETYKLYYDADSSQNFLEVALDYIEDVFPNVLFDYVLGWIRDITNNLIGRDEFFPRRFLNHYIPLILFSFKNNPPGLETLEFERIYELSDKDWFMTDAGQLNMLKVLNKPFECNRIWTLLNILEKAYETNDFDDYNRRSS